MAMCTALGGRWRSYTGQGGSAPSASATSIPTASWISCCNNEITPAVNQIEIHPFHQQTDAQALLKEYNIQAEAWGPFAEGKNGLFHNELLAGIGRKHGKSIAQVVLRWLLQRGIVAIPKSVHRDRMAENFDVFDFELEAEDLAAIAKLDQNSSSFFDHRDPAMVKWIGERKLDK